MPFEARDQGGELLGPREAESNKEYYCPNCGAVMTLRGGTETEVVLHFWHSKQGGCGYESDTHKRMKHVAAWKAGKRWQKATIKLEKQIGNQIADVKVIFENPKDELGKGVAIECQHKNESKNIEKTNTIYLEQEFSVLWLEENEFVELDVDFDFGKWVTVWPNAIPKNQQWDCGDVITPDMKQFRLLIARWFRPTRWDEVVDEKFTKNNVGPYFSQHRAEIAFGVDFSVPNREVEFYFKKWHRQKSKIPDVSKWGQRLFVANQNSDGYLERLYRAGLEDMLSTKIKANFFSWWFGTKPKYKREIEHAYNEGKKKYQWEQTSKQKQLDQLSDSAKIGFKLHGDSVCLDCGHHWPNKDDAQQICPSCGADRSETIPS